MKTTILDLKQSILKELDIKNKIICNDMESANLIELFSLEAELSLLGNICCIIEEKFNKFIKENKE